MMDFFALASAYARLKFQPATELTDAERQAIRERNDLIYREYLKRFFADGQSPVPRQTEQG